MGAGAISVAFVTPSDFPVVGALCLAVRWSPPDHSVHSVGFYLFLIPFFCLSVYFTFSQNLMLWIGWLGVEAGALWAEGACNGSRSLRVH